MLTEGKARIEVETPDTVSKNMEVFYNPVMKFNRTFSIHLLNILNKENMKLALPLAGSGIRGIRFLKELDKNKINKLYMNDLSEDAVKKIQYHIKINKINEINNFTNSKEEIEITNHEANVFLNKYKYFDYIDVDPFGSPNPFLDQSIKSLRRDAILAVTATDTAPLCGTYKNACKRKYWANPLRNELMHEIGLRILIRKVQLIGSQFDKALIPIVSISKDHYFRIFFINNQGKKKVDELLKEHGIISYENMNIIINPNNINNSIGPIWLGKLHQYDIINNLNKDFEKYGYSNSENRLINLLVNEAKFEKLISNEKNHSIGFFDLHILAKNNKIPIPKKKTLEEFLINNKIFFSWSHTNPNGIKVNLSLNEFLETIKEINIKNNK